MSDPKVPVGRLLDCIGRMQAAELDYRDAALPWLLGELPVPLAQLHHLVERLRVLDEAIAELRGEARAVYFLIKAERERNGDVATA